MLFRVLDLRAYQRGYDAYKESLKEPDMNKRPTNPAIERVRETVFEIAKEKIAAHRAREAAKGD